MTKVRRNTAGFILINHCNYPAPAALPMAKQIMVLIKFHYVVSLAYKLQMDEELFWYDVIPIYIMTNMIFKEFLFIFKKDGLSGVFLLFPASVRSRPPGPPLVPGV